MSAYKDGRDGTWRYRKWIQLPSGQRKRITGTPNVNTKVAAEEAERLHIDREMHPDRYVQPAAPTAVEPKKEVPTLGEFSVTFLAEWPGVTKPSARDSLKSLVKSLVEFFGEMRLDEIDQQAVNRYNGTMRKLARGTVNNRLAALSSILEYAITCKHITRRSEDDQLALHVDDDETNTPITALPADDVERLLAACEKKRDRLVVLLCAEAGLRVGEVLGVQQGDIKDGQLTVRRQIDGRGNIVKPKHDVVRTIPLSESLVTLLGQMKRRGLWLVCKSNGDPLTYQGVRWSLIELYNRAGVTIPATDAGIRRPFHCLRHAFGTESVRRGVPVPVLSELMGHQDLKTTMGYVDISEDDKRSAIARAFPRRATVGQQQQQKLAST